MKTLFTLETLTTLLIILAFISMFTGVLAKSFTLMIIGILIVLVPLPIIALLDNE